MAQYYELVVYTSQLPTYADPILDRLDPQRMIQFRCVPAQGGLRFLGATAAGQGRVPAQEEGGQTAGSQVDRLA